MVTRLDINTMPKELCRKFDVILDGQMQKHCVVADAEKGYVLRYRTTPFGTIAIGRNNKALVQRVDGIVEIVKKIDQNL